jgi:hypothetical protein
MQVKFPLDNIEDFWVAQKSVLHNSGGKEAIFANWF